jgi:ribosomal protein S18 acetylase RimI-like enzyme
MVEANPGLKVPVALELPKPEERVFDNKILEKKERKITKLDVKFGELNDKNVEQFRILNYVNLPVIYSEDFYRRLTSFTRYSKLAYLKDILVGAISCKEDTQEDGSKAVYIMTITVLKPYRRFGIASQLLEQAIEDCAKSRAIKKMTLHVQKGNDSAMEFYKKHGFIIKEELKDYYADLTPADCFILEKHIE